MIVIDYETHCSEHAKQTIDDALIFACGELMPRTKKPFFVNVYPIYNLTETQGVNGDCLDEGDREFTIRIDTSLPIKELITTLVHEMVHIQQYLSKRLFQKTGRIMRFEGVDYNTDMEYNERPWEIEAHALEKIMMERMPNEY